MTGHETHRGLPGSWLLGAARLLFDEPTISRYIEPTLADLQRELHDSGTSRARRVTIRFRAYLAFWVLVAGAPVWFRHNQDEHSTLTTVIHVLPSCAIAAVLVVCMWPLLGWSMAFAAAGGTVLAVGIHRWNDRHPTVLAAPRPRPGSHAMQINIASTPIDANVGGLIFMIGSIAILAIGLPMVGVFLVFTAMGGATLAWGLFAWRTAHPAPQIPENSIGRLTARF